MSLRTLGAELRSTREKKSIPLARIASETRISLRHLESIEEGRYGDLPGGMYNRAFLRGYCDVLGIDPAPVLERYEAESTPSPEKPSKAPTAPRPERRVPALALWSGMFAVSIASLYLSRGTIARLFSSYFVRRPSVAAAPPVAAAPVPARVEASTAAVATPPPALPPAPETVAQADTPGSRVIRLEFEVLQKCWISLHSDGSRVISKVLEPGDRQSFEASENFELKLGNAGGLRVKLNGKAARPLGAPGEVVTTLISRKNLAQFYEASPQ